MGFKLISMSNIGWIIEERATPMGNFLVGRLLPFRQKRMVGPFIFIDHMGPAHLQAEEALAVAAHPHIGLCTLTYLLEGSITHRDSLGNKLDITPGAVNWMTAGKGVTHSERTPENLVNVDTDLHGLQIWVALPKDKQDIAPNFMHLEADAIPSWSEAGLHFKLIAGEVLGKKSPVPVYSPLYLIELVAEEDQNMAFGEELYGECGLYILEGEVATKEGTFGEKQLLVTSDANMCEVYLKKGARIYLFGGEAFAEERHIYWNFVHTDKEVIERAKADWQAGRFPQVIDESEIVPLPEK